MEKLDQLMQLVQFNSSMQLDRFMYTEGKVTRKTDLDADRFSKKVKRAYGASAGDQCWCLLTDDKLPRSTVIGAHLFKWEWAEDVYLLGCKTLMIPEMACPSGNHWNGHMTPRGFASHTTRQHVNSLQISWIQASCQ